MLYYETIQKAIEYIESHLKDDICLYDIAEHVNFSVPHFYRIFKGITGETVKYYMLRRRLLCAAFELKTSDKNISEIAYEFGFESHDVFTRAFFRVYKISPRKYRNSNVDTGINPPIISKMFYEFERRNSMNFEIVNKNQFIVIGMECKAKQWDADGAIGKLWSMFLENVEMVNKPVIPNVMYGICESESCNGSGTFTYLAGIGVDESCIVPDGMVRRIIKQHKYILADAPESIKTPDAYNKTYEFAEQNGFKIDKFDEIEVYEEVFHDPDDHAFKLLIPII